MSDVPLSEAPATFPCPRCGSAVAAGATRCLVCAARGGVPAEAPVAAAAESTPVAGRIVALGCFAFLLLGGLLAGTIYFLGTQLRQMQVREQKRQQQESIDVERRRFEAEQRGRGAHVAKTGSGELAALAMPLVDVTGQTIAPAQTVEHGGVVVIYPQGCEDCTRKLASAEKVIALARRNGLGAQLIVMRGTPEGVAKDPIPASLRDCVLLDTDGKLGAALQVLHLTAIVVDSDGQSLVYKGGPEEAAGMVASVAQGE